MATDKITQYLSGYKRMSVDFDIALQKVDEHQDDRGMVPYCFEAQSRDGNTDVALICKPVFSKI